MARHIMAFVAVVFLSLMASPSAHAIGIGFAGPSVSIIVSYNTTTGDWIIGFDPDGVQSINLGLSYDTQMFSYVPSLTGFLCDFSDGGDCPTGTGQSGLSSVPVLEILPGPPRPNTTATLLVNETAGTVNLSYDLSQNPPPLGQNRQFFQLALMPLMPLSTNTVFVHNQPGAYDLSVTNVNCVSQDQGMPSSCGTNTAAFGVSFNPVPIPAAIWLFATGLLGLVGIARK